MHRDGARLEQASDGDKGGRIGSHTRPVSTLPLAVTSDTLDKLGVEQDAGVTLAPTSLDYTAGHGSLHKTTSFI
jgi:hypothetical protein